MSEILLFEPDDSGPKPPSNPRRSWGWGLLSGGCLTAFIAYGTVAASSVVLIGDLMSGGMVAGHGQDEINRTAVSLAVAPIFLVLGIAAALVGLVLLVKSKSKKNESN
jgi:ABC-type Fe3+ transport system permease subunit